MFDLNEIESSTWLKIDKSSLLFKYNKILLRKSIHSRIHSLFNYFTNLLFIFNGKLILQKT